MKDGVEIERANRYLSEQADARDERRGFAADALCRDLRADAVLELDDRSQDCETGRQRVWALRETRGLCAPALVQVRRDIYAWRILSEPFFLSLLFGAKVKRSLLWRNKERQKVLFESVLESLPFAIRCDSCTVLCFLSETQVAERLRAVETPLRAHDQISDHAHSFGVL